MDVDASKQAKTLDNSCRRCGEVGHWKNKCPRRFDVRFMTLKEEKEYVQQLSQKKGGETVGQDFLQSDE